MYIVPQDKQLSWYTVHSEELRSSSIFVQDVKVLLATNYQWRMVDAVFVAVGREGKAEMSLYLPENTKTGDFNPQRTLSASFFVIPGRFASIRAVVLAFPPNKQTLFAVGQIFNPSITHAICDVTLILPTRVFFSCCCI